MQVWGLLDEARDGWLHWAGRMDGCRVSAAPRVRGQDAARSTRRKRSTASEVLQPAKQASKSSSQKSEAIRNDEPTLGKSTSQVVLEYMIPSSHPLVEMHRIRKSAGTAPPQERRLPRPGRPPPPQSPSPAPEPDCRKQATASHTLVSYRLTCASNHSYPVSPHAVAGQPWRHG